ncbi:MAG: hypothetical protein GC162_06645 [Planctomycetes bacterium]|nr:hypothetical protein [Planctomycetota bacterium]
MNSDSEPIRRLYSCRMLTHAWRSPMLRHISLIALGLLVIAGGTGCSTAPKSAAERSTLVAEAGDTIKLFEAKDPGLQQVMDRAAGYAVFPSVGKGGVGVGGAYGRGILYERGKMTGYCDLSQGTIGFQLGGQSYREMILFQTDAAVRQFKSGEFALAAQASAVAATEGAARHADYANSVLVFTIERGGLMYEATVGGQNFSFQAIP